MSFSSLLLVLCGGALVGASAAVLWTGLHRIAGISGICGALFDRDAERGWRLTFLLAMATTGLVLSYAAPDRFGPTDAPLGRVVLGGLLVGFGTRLGNGCTSGHGVCGVSRLSPRSFLAAATFIGVGMLTVGVFRAITGQAP